jgi:LacI family transcriptional regulator
MERPTIADVAQRAGVSKSTVSRVLNGSTTYIRDATRQRVMEAVKALGYRPSTVARSLVSKRTQSVALLISDVANPFYPEVIHGVEDVALAHDYDVFLCNTSYDLDRGMAFVRSLADKRIDGAMLMSSSMSDELVLELARNQIPTVVLDWHLGKIEGIVSTVAVDFETGIRAAADHLVDLGHQRFAHVSGPLHLRTARVRRDTFLAGLAAHGIHTETVPVVEGHFRIDGGGLALAKLLDRASPPTAIFSGNDLMALGILWAARERGVRIPEDLSLIGLDDIQLAAEVSPSLASVALPRHQIGSLTMSLLLDLIAMPQTMQQSPVREEIVETRLVVRQSTAPPGR